MQIAAKLLLAATAFSLTMTTAVLPVSFAKSKKAAAPVITEVSTMQDVYNFLKATKTYYIATVEGNQPRVRPFGTVDIFENKLYIQTGKKKNVAKQIAANPLVEICAFDGQKWIRISAELVADERIEAQDHMLNSYPELRKMYTPGDGNTIVYYLKNATATFSSFGAEDKVVTF